MDKVPTLTSPLKLGNGYDAQREFMDKAHKHQATINNQHMQYKGSPNHA